MEISWISTIGFLGSENGVSLQMVIESLVIWPGGAVGVNATMVITSISWDIAPKTHVYSPLVGL